MSNYPFVTNNLEVFVDPRTIWFTNLFILTNLLYAVLLSIGLSMFIMMCCLVVSNIWLCYREFRLHSIEFKSTYIVFLVSIYQSNLLQSIQITGPRLIAHLHDPVDRIPADTGLLGL